MLFLGTLKFEIAVHCSPVYVTVVKKEESIRTWNEEVAWNILWKVKRFQFSYGTKHGTTTNNINCLRFTCKASPFFSFVFGKTYINLQLSCFTGGLRWYFVVNQINGSESNNLFTWFKRRQLSSWLDYRLTMKKLFYYASWHEKYSRASTQFYMSVFQVYIYTC